MGHRLTRGVKYLKLFPGTHPRRRLVTGGVTGSSDNRDMKVCAALLLCAAWAYAQPNCPATPIYTPCDLAFEMNPAEASANPNPYVSVTIRGEFRSPGHKTYLMPGFWDGGNRLVIRFTPVEAGNWDFRVTSSIERFNGNSGSFEAIASDALGFVRGATMHHWATHYTENPVDRKPHLWMGDTNYRFAFLDRPVFEQIVNKRAGFWSASIHGSCRNTFRHERAKSPSVGTRP